MIIKNQLCLSLFCFFFFDLVCYRGLYDNGLQYRTPNINNSKHTANV